MCVQITELNTDTRKGPFWWQHFKRINSVVIFSKSYVYIIFRIAQCPANCHKANAEMCFSRYAVCGISGIQKSDIQKGMFTIGMIFVEIFTGRNEVLAKVIFLHLSVIHSVHRGGGSA